jgi:hypothetical protein
VLAPCGVFPVGYGPGQMRNDVNALKAADFYAVYIGFRCVAAVN